MRSSKRIQLVVFSVVVAAAIVGISRLRQGQDEPTHLSIDQILADPMEWQGKKISVMGVVLPGSRQRFGAEWRFNIASGGRTLSVRYSGITPDTFVDAAEVFVIGQLRDREFSARDLLVKVPG